MIKAVYHSVTRFFEKYQRRNPNGDLYCRTGQGTTTSRAILFNSRGEIVSKAQYPFRQIFPQPGWVEHDPMEIWATTVRALSEAVDAAHIDPKAIAGIGITNQRETAILWSRRTGQPVYNGHCVAVPSDGGDLRPAEADGLGETVTEKTGLLIDAYFSGTKLKWIMDNIPGVRQRAERGELCAGTVDQLAYLEHDRREGPCDGLFQRSRTMLFNIHTLQWDPALCAALDIPMDLLPEPKSNSEVYGHLASGLPGLEDLAGIPVCGSAGDQQSALFGQACFTPGQAKNTYGTGCFTLMNVGDTPVRSRSGLVTSVGWQVAGKTVYALEGSVFNAGSTIQWLRDELGLIQSAPECDRLAESVPDSGGVVVVPAFTGLGAPYWDMYAGHHRRLTRGSTKAHIARAVLECIAYQTADLVRVMNADAPSLDGTAGGRRRVRQRYSHADPSGSAAAAGGPAHSGGDHRLRRCGAGGTGRGVWHGFDELAALRRSQCVFRPRRGRKACLADLARWHRAVERSRSWIENNV